MVGGEEIKGITDQIQKFGAVGKEAAAGTQVLTGALDSMFRTIGYGYVGVHLTSFLNQLGLMGKESRQLGPLIFENTKQLQSFTKGLGYAVGGMTAFLREMDKIERKQAELNRALGIGAVSITQYYDQLATATGMGGKAARSAAEDIMKTLTEQRMWTEQEINQMLPLFIKYSYGISRSFPRDFVYMHEQLGMQMDEIVDSYEAIALNAAAAGVPLELYKNIVFSLTTQMVQYGFSVRDAMTYTNLFTDDLKKGTMTAREAQSVMQTLTQAQVTGGGFGFRVKMAMFLGRAWGEVPTDVKEELEGITRRRHGEEARFLAIGAGPQARVMQEAAPGTFGRMFGIAAKESMRTIPEAARPMAFPGFWPGMEYMAFEKRIEPALRESGKVFTKSIEEGMEDASVDLVQALDRLRETMETSTKGMREWYYPALQLMDWLRAQGLGGIPAVAGAALGAAPGAIVMAMALRGVGFGGMGGLAGGMGGAAAAAGGLGMLRMSATRLIAPLSSIAMILGVLVAAMWSFEKVMKAVTAAQDLVKVREEEKGKEEWLRRTPAGEAISIMAMARSQQLYEAGKTDLAEKALREVGLKIPVGYPMEELIAARYRKYKGELGPRALALETLVRPAFAPEVTEAKVEIGENEIRVVFAPLIIPLGKPPTIEEVGGT